MITRVEERIDALVAVAGLPTAFVVPGGSPVAAALDVARTVVRRAERRCVSLAAGGGLDDSHVVPYLNRLADYVYLLARSSEEDWLATKEER